MLEEHHLETTDGVHLYVTVEAPSGEPRGSVLLAHAMMADGGYLRRQGPGRAANSLLAAGFRVAVLDFRGHGRSGPQARRGRDWSFDHLAHIDLPTAAAHLRSTYEGPIHAVGHSLGGLAALVAASEAPTLFNRVVTVTSNTWSAPPAGTLAWIQRHLFLTFYRSSAELLGHFPAHRLMRGGVPEPLSYVRQTSRWFRNRTWTSADEAIDYQQNLSAVSCPVLALSGAGDRFLGPEDSIRDLHSGLVSTDCRVWALGRAVGLDSDPGHFPIIRGPEVPRIWPQVGDWLSQGTWPEAAVRIDT